MLTRFASIARPSLRPSLRCLASTADGTYNTIITEKRGNVALITLNRPKALNALCDELIAELNDAARSLDKDPEVKALVITGSERAFAAGADITEMCERDYMEAYASNMFEVWGDLAKIKTPSIAAVRGFALGGGCELAMTCDIMIAGESAKFGQPEIKLGTIPGCGGTQRLTRAVGKSKAMELILTGDMFSAQDAEKAGLVCRVVPDDELVDAALKIGEKIAQYSKPIAAMCKEAVNKSYEMTLKEGLDFERRLFHSTFSTNDQKIGMRAFVNKEKANFSDS